MNGREKQWEAVRSSQSGEYVRNVEDESSVKTVNRWEKLWTAAKRSEKQRIYVIREMSEMRDICEMQRDVSRM